MTTTPITAERETSTLKTDTEAMTPSESSPLTSNNNNNSNNHKSNQWNFQKHLSIMADTTKDTDEADTADNDHETKRKKEFLPVFFILFFLLFGAFVYKYFHAGVLPVERAQEHWLNLTIDGTKQIWFRTWGRQENGIPVVFVHGGPGNAIADYFGNSNQRFFDPSTMYVIEVDQRGTGKSQPSVRDGWENMKYYQDISIDQIVDDFELIREHLGIDSWMVFGGSFGSTLAIHYGQRYPDSCTGLILRGIYLDSAEEVYTVYSRDTYLDNPKRLVEFNVLYEYADLTNDTGTTLDPNDAEGLMRIYADLIAQGDDYAIWHWFVFENNLMELDPQNILDPNQIDNKFYREALSVAFFETHLWLRGSFDEPTSDLMNPAKIDNLTLPIWVCQGQRDEVCPPQYARRFVNAVETTGRSPRVVSRFLDATHEDTDPVLEACLQRSVEEFTTIERGRGY